MKFFHDVEARMERLSGSLWRLFPRPAGEPVEVLEALRRECDAKAVIVGRDRTVVPNAFELELPAESYARLADEAGAVGERLASEVRRHAAERHFSFAGPVAVRLRPPRDGNELHRYRLHSSITPRP
ncbi:FhaA domain-containing protein [Streptomyces sp. CA-250714]|uniref:FhaA domain-containing protein n=1 Tax=Streptomyces sp. CA-250714 TaxID=3240060 RepID=UPI003D8C1062